LRQFSKIHTRDKKQIQVGFIGYPNVGKSSVINSLRAKAVCNVAPVPGQTRVWQYITLSKKIYLIDCPGVVNPPKAGLPTGAGVFSCKGPDGEAVVSDHVAQLVLRGAVRVENLRDPESAVEALLPSIRHQYIIRSYGLKFPDNSTVAPWTSTDEFLEILARRLGRLGKGGNPDLGSAARTFLTDLQRGKVPYFVPPPPAPNFVEGKGETAKVVDAKEEKTEKS